MTNLSITYRFRLSSGLEEVFDLTLDASTLQILSGVPDRQPQWTKLEFQQCPNCPLTPDSTPHCPMGVHLVQLVQRFDGVMSHDELLLTVVTKERTVSQNTSAQRAVGSLMGLIISTSGCPRSAFLRPMAHFHLPLASSEETVYRASSMYLLAQYFLMKEGRKSDFELEGLKTAYRELEIVNRSFTKRLKGTSVADSPVNAVVLLDVFAKTAGTILEGSLHAIRPLFDPYFTEMK